MDTMTLDRPSLHSVVRWARSGFRERRVSRRHSVAGLWCDKGQVLDLSGMGLRLKSARRWQEGRLCSVTLGDGQISICLEVRCVWCRQDGLFSHQIGLLFERVDAEQNEQLTRLVAAHEAATPESAPADSELVDPGDTE